MSSRRDFLAAWGALALGRIGGVPAGGAGVQAGLPGLQLFTLRDELGRDFEGTLARIAEMGYREVELVSTHGRRGAEVRRILDRLGLSAVSQHIAPEAIETDWGRTFGEAAELGCRYLVVAWLPPETRRTVDDWRRWGRRLTRSGEAARQAGLGFAYHNHDFEFRPVARRIPFDVLLRESDPALVSVELDLYWVTKGGQDPLDYLRRLNDRVRLVHVKDMDRTPARGMADPGEGILDFPTLLGTAARAGVRHYFIEHDSPRDGFETARKGVALLRRLLP